MVQVPSSPRDVITSDPAFVQARLTLERCIRDFQQRQCAQNAAAGFQATQQLNLPPNQCTCGCPQGCCPVCVCKFPDRFQAALESEWVPTQFVINLLRQVFQSCLQQPQELQARFCVPTQDQSGQLAAQFIEYLQSQLTQQPDKTGESTVLVQALPGPGQISLTPNHFQLVVDVSGIQPNELNVSVTGRCILIGAERKGRVTGVTHQEALLRRYELPMNADSDQAQCCLSPEGLLHIAAPWRDS